MTTTGFILQSNNFINLSDYKSLYEKTYFENKTILCPDCLESLWLFKFNEHKSFYDIINDKRIDLNKLTKDFELLYKNESKEFIKNGRKLINHAHFSHYPNLKKICEEKQAPSTLHRELCDIIKNQLYKIFCFYQKPEFSLTYKEISYLKEPPCTGSRRIPDLSVLEFQSEIEKTLYERSKHEQIAFNSCDAYLAIELQLSHISKNEIKQRTEDHLKNYRFVVWIFHQNHLSKVSDARDYLDSIGQKYYLIKQDKDKKRDIEIVLCKKREKTKSKSTIKYKKCDNPIIINAVANHLQMTSDEDYEVIRRELKIKDSYFYCVAKDFLKLDQKFFLYNV